MIKREKVWVSFESDNGFPNKAKPLNRSDLLHFESETMSSEGEEPDWAEEMFDVQERYEEGSLLALHEIIAVCDEAQVVLPTWASEALQQMVIGAIKKEPFEKSARGRANSDTGKMREELKRYIRKQAVERVRFYQALEPCIFSYLILPIGLKKAYREKGFPDLGQTTEEAIYHASVGLRGTFAQASEETIRKAYAKSDEQGWGGWVWSRKDSLVAIGAEEEDNVVLPYEAGEFSNDTYDATHAPFDFHLIDGAIQLDDVSAQYVEEAQKFEYFEDFIESERRRRRAENS